MLIEISCIYFVRTTKVNSKNRPNNGSSSFNHIFLKDSGKYLKTCAQHVIKCQSSPSKKIHKFSMIVDRIFNYIPT